MIAVPHCGSGELAIGFWTEAGDSRLIIDAIESNLVLLATAQTNAAALNLSGRNMYMRYGSLSTNIYSLVVTP